DVQGSYAILAWVYLVLLGIVANARMAARAGRHAAVAVVLPAFLLGGASLLLFAGKLHTLRGRIERRAAGALDEFQIGQQIGAHTAPGDVLFGGSFGLAGYFSDRAWINGDGVANTRAYQDAIRDGSLRDHVAKRGVNHLVFTTGEEEQIEPGTLRIAYHGVLANRDATLLARVSDTVVRLPSLRSRSEIVLVRWSP